MSDLSSEQTGRIGEGAAAAAREGNVNSTPPTGSSRSCISVGSSSLADWQMADGMRLMLVYGGLESHASGFFPSADRGDGLGWCNIETSEDIAYQSVTESHYSIAFAGRAHLHLDNTALITLLRTIDAHGKQDQQQGLSTGVAVPFRGPANSTEADLTTSCTGRTEMPFATTAVWLAALSSTAVLCPACNASWSLISKPAHGKPTLSQPVGSVPRNLVNAASRQPVLTAAMHLSPTRNSTSTPIRPTSYLCAPRRYRGMPRCHRTLQSWNFSVACCCP
ncbi:uncharacterized protein EI97DRAFT_500023 [Westerdykella ornata]|uniref:Uncharacterized protein n=1 Tax=Westerdykella ornata TaxID=318751 RepID=A0A6A6JNG9_WESOR|nr:uncharacterized protein EI97DRAFT_500023 [Westerdykella ornata]KAF2277775.1 hypothetical protein EI97DRAFT_500023 [Westerdykella ornata]